MIKRQPSRRQWAVWAIRLLFIFYLALGGLGFSRLIAALNQPFGGFIWLRDDVHGFSVSWETGRDWAGRRAGLELDDRILRIEGREIPIGGEPDVIGAVYREAEIGQLIDYEIERQGERLRVQAPVTRFTWLRLLESYAPFYAAGLVTWAIGLLVHLVTPADRSSSVFALMCLTLSAFLFSRNFSGSIHKFFDARWTTCIVYAPVWPMFNALAVHFFSIFPTARPWWPRIRAWVYGVCIAIAAVYSYSFVSWGDARLSDPMLILTTLSTVIACFYGLVALVCDNRHSASPRTRQQVSIIGWGMGLGMLLPFLSICAYVIFRPYPGVWWSPGELLGARVISDWFVPLPLQMLAATIIFSSFVAIAILRYQVFDAKPALVKATTTGALAAGLIVVYSVIVHGVQMTLTRLRVDAVVFRLLGEHFDWVWISNALATLATAVIFAPLRDRLREGVSQLLYPYRITAEEALSRIVEGLRQIDQSSDGAVDTPQALRCVLVELLHLADVFIWFYLPVTGELQLVSHPGAAHPPLFLSDEMRNRLVEANRAFQPAERVAEASVLWPLYERLVELGAPVGLPLVYRERELVGLIGLGARRDEAPFGPEDWRLLRHLAEYLLLLLKNARTIRALEQSRERVSIAQEMERQRIAQELHDATLHDLSFLATVQLERCKRALGDPDQATQLIEETRAKIREAATELRSRLADISPDIIANRGLVSALESLVDAARTRPEASGAAIKLHVDGYANKMLPEQQELAVFRCLQEALHNALRHAQASRVEVRLEIAGGWVIATVQDDGVGIERARINDALREGRLGLRNMWDRVEALEGEFRLRSHPGEGTTVWAAIPLPEESAADAISGG